MIKINSSDTVASISFFSLMFKKLKISLKKPLNKYESGLIKKLMKGISVAIEIDSAKEARRDKVKTVFSSFFLLVSK